MHQADFAGDLGASVADDRTPPLCFVGEWRGQQCGAGAGEDERDDRLARSGHDRDLGCDVDGGERLLEQDPRGGARVG